MKSVLILSIILVVAFSLALSACGVLGSLPSKEEQSRFATSPNYDTQKHVFRNRVPEKFEGMASKIFSTATLTEFWNAPKNKVPLYDLPQLKPDMVQFLAPSKSLKVIWLGHSTFLLNIEGKILLVDPVFGDAIGPFPLSTKRFQKSALSLAELPHVDFVLVSHDHYDHLEMEAVKFFIGKQTQFLVPLGVAAHLKGWGVPTKQIAEFDWWQSFKADGLEVVATPAQHDSGRGIRKDRSLWASWVVIGKAHRVFYSGDTGFDVHFKEIGQRFGPFDIAFMETGQYHPRFPEGHLVPQQGLQAFKDVNAKRYFPVHWGAFQLNFHPWYEPVEVMSGYAKENGFEFVSPKMGELVEITEAYKSNRWWEELMALERRKGYIGTAQYSQENQT